MLHAWGLTVIRWTVVVMSLLCLPSFFGGCGPDYGDRQEVSGTISLKGVPLKQGVIEFLPIGSDGATKGGAVIADGKYQIPRASGLVPGKYRVLISAPDAMSPINSDQPPGPSGNYVAKDLLPPEYNTKSKQEIEVKKPGPNVFDFPIP
jgi:hypothetical protein